MYLLSRAKSPLCICELMDALNKPQYKISRCLTILKEAKLIKEERVGRLLMHSPDFSDPYNKHIFDCVENINVQKNTDLIADIDNLNERLSLRENGKVVVTYSK